MSNIFKNMHIKFVSYLSTSGYSKNAQDWIHALATNGANVTFEPLHQNNINDPSVKYQTALSLINKQIKYNTVIVCANPYDIQKTCIKEKEINSKVKIYGFSVWEADRIPKKWIEKFNLLDGLLVQSEWNKQIYQKDINIPIHVVYQPFDYKTNYTKQQVCNFPKFKMINHSDYVFYSINAWNGRKNMEAMIRAYLKTFKKSDKVVLFVKTFLNNYNLDNKLMLNNYINNIIKQYPDAPKLVINTDLWNDEQINKLHSVGDCFVSTTHAEGIGLGACIAGSLGKRVIITGYSALTEYLKNVDFIKYKLVPADNCHWGPIDHSKCKKNICNHIRSYNKSYQQWAEPDIEHFCQLMKNAYHNKNNKKTTAEYIKKAFDTQNIMRRLKSIIETH